MTTCDYKHIIKKLFYGDGIVLMQKPLAPVEALA